MRDRLDELGATTRVALITFTDPVNLAEYGARNEVPFPILVDRDRTTYRSYGLGRGSIWRVWGWQAALGYLRVFRDHGVGGLRRPTEDTLQLGGDFVVGPDGTLVYGFWGAGPDDRPDVDELVCAVQTS